MQELRSGTFFLRFIQQGRLHQTCWETGYCFQAATRANLGLAFQKF